MSFIEIRNVWQRYGDQVVLEQLNLRIAEGEFCTLVGASGCGKSTFLRLLLGQERPSKGELRLEGRPLPAEPDAQRGVVFQRYSVFPHLNVLDNVAVGLELRAAPLLGRLLGQRKRAAREAAAEMLHRVGLGHALARYWLSSRAACSNAWPSPRRSSPGRACCCSTSPSARWTPAYARTCTRCCSSSGARPG